MSEASLGGSFVLRTSAGLCAVWQPEHFSAVTDFDVWEDEVAEDVALVRHIDAGALVPLNVGGDGAFQVVVRAGGLTEREARYVIVSSDPYLLISQGVIEFGGLESIGTHLGGAFSAPLAAGRYAVTVHMIDWEAEPGGMTDEGGPSENALPDLVVEVRPESEGLDYRKAVTTFPPPPDLDGEV